MPTKDPERRRQLARERYRRNPDKHKAEVLAWRQANPERVADYQRKRKYGLPHGEYARMVEVQGGRCVLCNQERRLVVDHRHADGVVRGLLCHGCNAALGFVERPGWLPKALAYVQGD